MAAELVSLRTASVSRCRWQVRAWFPLTCSLVPIQVAGSSGCSREDIELAPARSETRADSDGSTPLSGQGVRDGSLPVARDDAGSLDPTWPTDCSATVPAGLLGARPPMGWNGYNAFYCGLELDQAKVHATVEALIESGMQAAGYEYVNLDACWELPRAADGRRSFDPVRLPDGIEALSDFVHARGLSLGVWAPTSDCRGTPGVEGFETQDAQSYAEWGIDYVKYVHCGGQVPERVVASLATALADNERPILLSLVGAPFQEWMPDVAQLWRTSDEARPTWASLVNSIDTVVPLAAYARPGAFNDPDMLEIGNGALTLGENRVQFALWSILSAPLIAGNDLTTMSEETRAILTNARLIAVNQDPLGLQAALIVRQGNVEVLAKPLAACGARALVAWNRGESDAEVFVTWPELWLEPGAAQLRELWNDVTLEVEAEGIRTNVPAHDAVALRVDGLEPPLPQGRVYLSDLAWTYVTNGFGPVELDQTNGEEPALDGRPIRLRGAAYDKGLGVHGPSLIRYQLGQRCSHFVADVGIDDDQDGRGSVQFEVWADGERLFQSGNLTGASPVHSVSLDVKGRRELRLFVGTGGDTYSFDHAVWAGAMLDCE